MRPSRLRGFRGPTLQNAGGPGNGFVAPIIGGAVGTGNVILSPYFGGGGAVITPALLPSMYWWGKSYAGITLDGTNTFVVDWADQSGRNNDAFLIPSALVGPPFYDLGVMNGRPAVRCQEAASDGADAFLACQLPTGGLPAPGAARTLYTLLRMNSAIGGNLHSQGYQSAPGANPVWIMQMFLFGGIQYGGSDGVATACPFGAPVNYTGQDVLIEHHHTGAVLSVYVNEVLRVVAPDLTSVETAANGFCVGGWMPNGFTRSGLSGSIVEQIAYAENIVVGSAANNQNRAYLKAIGGLP